MAAAAPSNPFSIFIRKIGFSVGLEHTLERIDDFARVYGSQDSFGAADVSRLLHERWRLKQTNEHILDVMRALDIFQMSIGNVGILETGEALGILFKLTSGAAPFGDALRLLFLQSLVRADGDIFLNALACEFDEEEFRAQISRMIEYKWSELEKHFRTPQHLGAMYRAVTIEAQENNPGSSRSGSLTARMKPDPDRLTARTGPLQSLASRPKIKVTEAYLRKALPRRKAWAVSLDLCDVRGRPSELGREALATFAAAGYSGPNCMAVWPLQSELEIPIMTNFSAENSFPRLSSWEFFVLAGRALRLLPGAVSAPADDRERSKALGQLKTIWDTYRSLNVTKSITRVELPVRIAYLCVLGLATNNGAVLDYPDIIRHEQRTPFPRIIARKSKLAELALSGAAK